MYKPLNVLFLIIIVFAFTNCKKESKADGMFSDAPTVPISGKSSELVFDFKAFVSNKPLNDSTWHKNFYGDSFTVRRLNYYISNIKLKRADGSIFSEPESYHLIKHFEAKESFTLAGVPEGSFSSIEFIIGVDSAKTVSGAHGGDLDVMQDMFWDWNTGYIFMKFEGIRKTSKFPEENNYGFHVGGYRVPNNCLQKCTFNLSSPLVTKAGKTSKVFYHAEIQEMFVNPTNLDFESLYDGGSRALKTLSDNYSDLFIIDHVEN